MMFSSSLFDEHCKLRKGIKQMIGKTYCKKGIMYYYVSWRKTRKMMKPRECLVGWGLGIKKNQKYTKKSMINYKTNKKIQFFKTIKIDSLCFFFVFAG